MIFFKSLTHQVNVTIEKYINLKVSSHNKIRKKYIKNKKTNNLILF